MAALASRHPYLATEPPPLPQIAGESSKAYEALVGANMLTTKYRRESVEAIFVDGDREANSDHWKNFRLQCLNGVYCCPFGVCMYNSFRSQFFIPAGNVGLLQNEANEYQASWGGEAGGDSGEHR